MPASSAPTRRSPLQDMPLWHERDISHSSAERVILPDSTILLDYIINKFCAVLEGLVVYPWKMLKNMELSGGPDIFREGPAGPHQQRRDQRRKRISWYSATR